MHPPSHDKHRSKRLRKKMRVAEFQQLGFSVENQLNPSVSKEAQDELLDSLIDDLLTPAHLEYGGGLEYGFMTCHSHNRKITEEDRQLVFNWFESRGAFSMVKIGPLQDCWYEGQVIYRQ